MTCEKPRLDLLYVTRETFPTFRVDLTELFSKELTEQDLYVHWVMATYEQRSAEQRRLVGKEEYILRTLSSNTDVFSKTWNQVVAVWHDITSLFSDHGCDIIQVRDKVIASVFGLWAARWKHVPFVYWMSWPFPETYLERARTEVDLSAVRKWYYLGQGYIGKWLLYRIVLPCSDHIFVQSDRMKEEVAGHGIDEGKMTPVPMGVSETALEFEALPDTELGMTVESPTITYLGTLDALRDIGFLLNVHKNVLEAFPTAKLLLIGDAVAGGLERLIENIEDLGIGESVHITGMVARNVAWSYVKKADVCVSLFKPNRILISASPTKLVEYMALGKPVVVNDQPEQRKLVGDSGGGIVVPYDVSTFAAAIENLLGNAVLAQEMGEQGRTYIRNHRVYSLISKKVMETYCELSKST